MEWLGRGVVPLGMVDLCEVVEAGAYVRVFGP
jgi:hypothetical protein